MANFINIPVLKHLHTFSRELNDATRHAWYQIEVTDERNKQRQRDKAQALSEIENLFNTVASKQDYNPHSIHDVNAIYETYVVFHVKLKNMAKNAESEGAKSAFILGRDMLRSSGVSHLHLI